MTPAERRNLQRMIDRTVKAGSAYYEAQHVLNDWCRDYYGNEPGDIDADSIIDAIFGGCGPPCGMSADEFHAAMGGAL